MPPRGYFKPVCVRGHDRRQEGVTGANACRKCVREDSLRRKWNRIEEIRKQDRDRFRRRYATGPAFREAHLARHRVWWHTTAAGQSAHARTLLKKEGRSLD